MELQTAGMPHSEYKPVWVNISFFAITTLIAIVGTPLYLWHHSLTWGDGALFLFYLVATGMSITVGYHRLFAHRTFKASPLIEFLILFFGAAAFEQSALRWASQHRDHHRFVDTERDPYNIRKGFFYAHIGWLIFWRHPYHYDNAKDLQSNPLLMHQDRYYFLWAPIAGILVPLLIGMAWGRPLAALIFAVCLRLTFVYHSTFCINSVCHTFGKATYDRTSTAKDHWFVAFLTFGEGYHNFHHRFPSDYRNAIRWYQWDPSKWAIWGMQSLGLARDLKKVSNFRILEAKLAAQNETANEWIQTWMADQNQVVRLKLDQYYRDLRQQLIAWEAAAKNYHALLCQQWTAKSEEFRKVAQLHLEAAKERFEASRRQWQAFQLSQFGLAV
jgi:stearoyl-CoA desaturase (delta-9 desaturase)